MKHRCAWACGLFLMLHGVAHAEWPAALQPIAGLEVSRYLGRWYEIAKFPNIFQRTCAADTSAHYSLTPQGHLQVLNQCRTASGETVQAVGLAKQLGDERSPKLKVRFAPEWLSFLPFVWGDYWVIELDPQYQWAAVSEPGRAYLWILSRQPTMDDTVYDALLTRLKNQGLEVSKLEKSPQTGFTRSSP